MRAPENRGFSLIELVIATGISSAVLIGVLSIAASMVQYEVESGRKSSVTAWSLASITAMNRDIASGSVIQWPNVAGGVADSLVICTNWSRLAGGGPPNGAQLSLIGPAPTVISYCWQAASNVLRRRVVAGNCPNFAAVPPACTAANYGGSSVVATGVYRIGANSIFQNDPLIQNAVRMQFVVGNPNQGTVNAGGGAANFVNPQSLTFDTKVLMEN